MQNLRLCFEGDLSPNEVKEWSSNLRMRNQRVYFNGKSHKIQHLENSVLNTKYSNYTYTTLTYLFLDERKYIGGRIHDCLLALKIQIWYFDILQQENVFFKISRTISMPGVVEYKYPIHR